MSFFTFTLLILPPSNQGVGGGSEWLCGVYLPDGVKPSHRSREEKPNINKNTIYLTKEKSIYISEVKMRSYTRDIYVEYFFNLKWPIKHNFNFMIILFHNNSQLTIIYQIFNKPFLPVKLPCVPEVLVESNLLLVY